MESEFYRKVANIFTNELNIAHAKCVARVIKERTDKDINALAIMISNVMCTLNLMDGVPIVRIAEEARSDRGDSLFGYLPEHYGNIDWQNAINRSPLFTIPGDLSISMGDDSSKPAFLKLLNAYNEILLTNHDFLENGDDPMQVNSYPSVLRSGLAEVLNVEPAEQVVATISNDAMILLYKEKPEFRLHIIGSICESLDALTELSVSADVPDRMKFTEGWLEKLFSPILYFTALDFNEEITPGGQKLSDRIGHSLDGFNLDFKVDTDFLSSTIFGEDFPSLNIDDVRSKLEEISASNKPKDRFRKHAARDLLGVVNRSGYGLGIAEAGHVQGMDNIKFIFHKDRKRTDYDLSHFWASENCTPTFLPKAIAANDQPSGQVVYDAAMGVRKRLGINDPRQHSFVDTYELAHATWVNTYERSFSNIHLAERLKKFAVAVLKANCTGENRKTVFEAIQTIIGDLMDKITPLQKALEEVVDKKGGAKDDGEIGR